MTKKIHAALTFIIAITMILSLTAFTDVDVNGNGNGGGGNGGGGGGGKGSGSGDGPLYFDADTVTTMTGTLTALSTDWVAKGNGNFTGTGQHYEFTSGGTTYDLILGPTPYLSANGLSLAVGDTITVTGSVVDAYIDGFNDTFIIATSITLGSTTVELRDEAGYPLWRGGKNGGANGRGVGQGPNGQNYFDPDTVTKLTGTLTENLYYWNAYGNGNCTGSGMHFIFESNGTSYYLFTGPFWFLEDNGVELEVGMNITVVGSVVDPYFDGYQDHDYLIAQTLTVNGTTVELRDDEGYPLWRSGQNGDFASPTYTKSTTSTMTATVTSVRYRSNGANLDIGMELNVKTANGNRYRVYTAPLYYCEQLDVSVAKGDQVKIRGSLSGKEVVAQYIKNENGRLYRFRTSKGTPRWQEGAQ